MVIWRGDRVAEGSGLLNRRIVKNSTQGSNPCLSTKFGLKVFMDAHQPVTLKEGDRYPLGPPRIISC